MPAPRNYVRGYSFAGYQATNPNRPLPGPALDNELEEIEQSLTEAISGLNDIRRADGQLRNGIVGRDALAPDLSTGVRPATLWQAGIQYQAQDTVSYLTSFYRCTIGHLSTDFLADLTATRWELYAEIGTLATDAQIARNEAVAAAAAAVPAGAAATAGSNNVTALYDLFDDRYLGEKTSLPTLDNDGNAIVDGALVSLTGQTPTTLNGMYVRRGGVWQPAVAGFQGILLGYRYVATGGQTVFTGADANGLSLAYTLGGLIVTVNGVTLSPNTYTATNGTSVVLGAALSASDVVVIYSFGSFSVANVNSENVAYAPPFVGAVPTVLRNVLSREMHVADFGAVLNGVADDTAAIQTAVTTAATEGAVLRMSGLIRLTNTVNLASRSVLFMDDAEIVLDSTVNFREMFAHRAATAGTAHNLTTNSSPLDRFVQLGAGAGANYAVGQWVMVLDDREYGVPAGNGRRGELAQLADVRSDRLHFTKPLYDGYLTANTARVVRVTMAEGIIIRGNSRLWGNNARTAGPLGASINSAGTAPTSVTREQRAVWLQGVYDAAVEGVVASDFHAEGLVFTHCVEATAQRNRLLAAHSAGSGAYQIAAYGAAERINFLNNFISTGRHGLGQGSTNAGGLLGVNGVTRGLLYQGNLIESSGGEGNAVDTHPNCSDAAILDNIIVSSALQGILSRGTSVRISRNQIFTAYEAGIQAINDTNDLGSVSITDNLVRNMRPRPTMLDLGASGNGLVFLPAETVTQLAWTGIIESYIGNPRRAYVSTISGGPPVTGTSQLQGQKSTATAWPINTVNTYTECFGIRVQVGQGYWSAKVSNNDIDGLRSPVQFIGVEVQGITGATVTDNNIRLPAASTGAGVHLNACFNSVATQNQVRQQTAGGSSNTIRQTGGSGNTNTPNFAINVGTNP